MTAKARDQHVVDVLLLWQCPPRILNYIKNRLSDPQKVRFHQVDGDSPDDWLAQVQGKSIFVGWRISENLLKAASELKLLLVPGAGVQHLAETYLKVFPNQELLVCNNHGNAPLTAQHAFSMLMALSKNLTAQHESMKKGRWRQDRKTYPSEIWKDQKIGFLGYGHIAKHIRNYFAGFPQLQFAAMKKRVWKEKPEDTKIFIPGQEEAFFSYCDVVLCSLPLTPESEGLISLKHFKALGSNGLFVNVGRGRVVKEKDLFQALDKKLIRGAALDVWFNYQTKPDAEGKQYPYQYPFHHLDNVLLSPHRGGTPVDYLERWDDIIENINRFLAGEEPINQVDLLRGY